VSYLDLNPYLIRQRNEEILREVRGMRLEKRLGAKRKPHSRRSDPDGLTWLSALTLVRRVGLSK
jgi:hypothetical protein